MLYLVYTPQYPLSRLIASLWYGQEDIVKQTIYIVKGQSIQDEFAAAQNVWGNHPTAISIVIVEGLGMPGPGVLVEIDAIAVIEV